MKLKLILLIIISIFLSCCCKKAYPPKEIEKQITKTEYVEKIRLDTLLVELPQESKEIVSKDTVSHLKISGAISDAMVSNGLLYHSLKTDPSYKPKVEVQIKEIEIVRDSLIYREIPVDMPRTKYERICINGFWGLSIILIILAFVKIKTKLL